MRAGYDDFAPGKTTAEMPRQTISYFDVTGADPWRSKAL
jgi:hypothetical protein